MTDDLYAALDLSRDASREDVRAAYRRASKRAHPDKGGTQKQWALVSLARDVLGDERRRQKYDSTGRVDDESNGALESRPMNLVMEAVHTVFARSQETFASVNVIAGAEAWLMRRRREWTQARAIKLKAAERGLAFAHRFSAKKGKQERIGRMVEAEANRLATAAEQDTVEIDAVDRALKILAEHSYEVDQSMPVPQQVMSVFNIGVA